MTHHFRLIRHAESASNAGLPTTLPSTIPLTPKGEADARRWAGAFAKDHRRPDIIFCSKYHRTWHTARPYLELWEHRTAHPRPYIHEFTFLSPGRYAGTTDAERKPAVEAYWDRDDPDYRDGEGAETFNEFLGRCRQLLDWLRTNPWEVWIFTHAQFIFSTTLLHRGIEDMATHRRLSYVKPQPVPNLASWHGRRDPLAGHLEFDPAPEIFV